MLTQPRSFVNSQTFEQSIWIKASISVVDRVITDRDYMHQWLNPMLRCEPIGRWSTDVGAESLFIIRIPLLKPTLKSRVAERSEGLVVWSFNGFFQGTDRWICIDEGNGTRLTNQFTFMAPNPLVALGFQLFAAFLTKRDMEQQLQRLKQIAERIDVNVP